MFTRYCYPPQRRVASVLSAFLLLLTVATLGGPAWGPYSSGFSKVRPSSSASLIEAQPQLLPISLPELEDAGHQVQPPDEFCSKRFTGKYLDDLRDHAMQYCPPDSRSSLTCFHAHVRSDNNADSFCIGTGASLDVVKGEFLLDCQIRPPDANESARGLIAFDRIVPYWFDTGPRRIFDKFVRFESGTAAASDTNLPAAQEKDARFMLLVKREGNNNLWHSLMEIWSMTMTFDVLRMSRDPLRNSAPFFKFPDDIENAQVVVLDDHVEESTFDLWRLFSRRQTIRLRDIINNPSRAPELSKGVNNIILPLAGGSNPLWQNDWKVRDCRDVPLLKLFVRRIFGHFGVPYQMGPRPTSEGEERDIILTFVNRTGSRKLLDHEALLDNLRGRYPQVIVQSIDLATMSFPEQLRLIQGTDILAGVHGAGLTHTMFMREGAGAVVEIQPADLLYKGFRNLAAMRGQRYFSAQAEMVLPGEEGERGDKEKPWQSSDVRIEEDRFMVLMDAAIKSLYNVGLRNHDVI